MSDLVKVLKPHVANKSQVADFAELECLRCHDGNVSALDLTRMILRESDEFTEEFVEQYIDETFNELADRAAHSGVEDGRYPYRVDQTGRLLHLRGDVEKKQIQKYLYLLLATRMNMKTERNQGGEDATKLFEQLCCEVCKRFWGGPSNGVGAFVFGTGREAESKEDRQELNQGAFKTAVDQLCRNVGEGLGFSNRKNRRITARDGKLDVVVWRRFADNRGGQLIGFGQCKTGTHWRGDLPKLQPEGFCAKWMRQRLAVLPIRLYFVADRVIDNWDDQCVDGGILFDRCRILEYSDSLPSNLIGRIGKWVKAAAGSQKLRLQ